MPKRADLASWLDQEEMDLPPIAPLLLTESKEEKKEAAPPPTRKLPPLGPPRTWKPERILVLDTESALRWFWYDDKGTNRTMMWVAQWVESEMPIGRIILPSIVLQDSPKRYVGLPVCDRITALNEFREIWTEAHLIIGHNVRGFDYVTMNGEMLVNNLPSLPSRMMHDTLRDMKKTAKQSRSLGNLMTRRTPSVKKPSVEPKVWEAAFNEYDPVAIREVWDRCVADVMGHYVLHQDLKNARWLNPPRKS